MFKNQLKAILLAGATALGLASCTVSEPDAPKGDASDLRLTGMTAYGIKFMDVEYDGQDRIVCINLGNSMIYNLTYSGNSQVPEQVTAEEYDYTYTEDDEEVTYLSSRDIWTDITTDGNGHITGFRETEVNYERYGSESGRSTGYSRFTYDSEGHLLSMTETTDGISSTRRYEWADGLLLGYDESGDHPQSAVYAYSDVENVNLQWDPNNNTFGPMAITGLFGKAPAKFFKSETLFYNGYRDYSVQYSYTLLDNGLIHLARLYGDDEDGNVVFTFTYEKK